MQEGNFDMFVACHTFDMKCVGLADLNKTIKLIGVLLHSRLLHRLTLPVTFAHIPGAIATWHGVVD
jgi:hypothetical protein